jgi:hypothetical protein
MGILLLRTCTLKFIKYLKFITMASKHQLSLELPDTNNIKVLRLFDTSLYAQDLAVDCGTLRITSPGFNLPVAIEILKGFNIVLNACSLGLQRTSCQDASQPLPDGIYVINYSVSPNTNVFVEYNHLRTTQTTNKYFNLLCDLEMSGCEPGADVKEKLEELRLIKSFIDAAKAKVEYGHEPQAGMELLIYAQKRLNRYATECAC